MDSLNAVLTECSVKGSGQGVLAGLKAGVKDNIAVKGVRMTCGSLMLKDYVAPYNATVVQRILDAGAEVTCKLNLDEFACGGSGETSAFGATLNPNNKALVPGGSSSGSGAAVASGLVDFSIGSDTGGSVRCPASFCGVAALKPTYGLVSRHGLSDMAMSLEGPAPIARDAETLAMVMGVVSGWDERDRATVNEKVSFALGKMELEKQRVAVLDFEGVDAETQRQMRHAFSLLEGAGVELEKVKLESLKYAIPAYYLIVYAEFSSAMQKFDGKLYGNCSGGVEENRGVLGKEVKRRIMLGTYVTMKEFHGKWYSKALAAREKVREEFEKTFDEYDFLLSPTMPFTPYELGSKVSNPLQMYLADVFTVSANLAGIPAGVVPVSKNVGLQVMAGRLADARVLEFMKGFESLRGML